MLDHLRRIEDRFWARAEQTPSCWLWTGAKDRCGYGHVRLSRGGRRTRIAAHRVAYALHHGRLPGPDEVVRHRCDQPACVRPDHLELGTQADNVRDRVRRGRSARGERNGRAKLCPRKVRTIRKRLETGQSMGALAREYGVCHKTVRMLRDRETWTHV